MTPLMWKGMKVGAILMGLLGFAAGVALCIIYKLPIPPVAITEVTAVFGACLGILVGWSWPIPVRRLTLLGFGAGFTAGLLWCVLRAHFEPLAWLAYVLLGTFLGHQSVAEARHAGEPWRLLR